MIAVYLLGHKVGDIEEPVLYVKHKALDYDGNHVTKGIPDPFVDSLTHDSIIVQIPRLRGHVNNRLDEVLSVFDQSQKEMGNHQVLSVDEDKFNGDLEMMHILHRLITAASDSKLRQDMNVEDEFFSAIENRDTAILQRDKKIASQQEILDSQDKKIATQDKKIATQDKKIATQDKKIATQDKKIASQDHEIASLKEEKERMGSKMRSMVKAMLDNGMAEETIAGILNISEEEVLRFAE